MSRATRHLERLLRTLRSDSTSKLGNSDTPRDELSPPASPDSTRAGGSKEKGTPVSSRVSLFSFSGSDEPSTPSAANDSKYQREETARLVQQLGDSRVQVATLEAQIEFLTNKVEEQDTVDSLYIQRLEGEVLRLEEVVEKEMCKLSKRQSQIEQDAPSLEEQLKTIKDHLHDFDVSESLYMELKSVPAERRTARDHILILAYEKYQRDREELQELRMARDHSREALTRANDEVQRLTRELQRVAANHATDRRESELDLSSHCARVQRLESDLRDSLVQIELLTAKGALYDEVQGRVDTLERSNNDLENQKAVMAANLQAAVQEKDSLRDALKEKDHTLDLLSMDKIYLSKEVHCQAEQLKKLEAELERQHSKLRDMKRAREELYNKVLNDNKEAQAVCEQRLQAEISRIQERTTQEIEKARKEAHAVADEKTRSFREMRDEAMATAEICRAELRDSKAAYDELLLKFREQQRVTESKGAETRNELKATCFELDKLKAVHEETKRALEQTRLENEAWVAKVKTLKEKVNEGKYRPIEELKCELEKLPVNELKEELRVTRCQIEAYHKDKGAQLKAYQSEKEAQLRAYQKNSHLDRDPCAMDTQPRAYQKNSQLDRAPCLMDHAQPRAYQKNSQLDRDPCGAMDDQEMKAYQKNPQPDRDPCALDDAQVLNLYQKKSQPSCGMDAQVMRAYQKTSPLERSPCHSVLRERPRTVDDHGCNASVFRDRPRTVDDHGCDSKGSPLEKSNKQLEEKLRCVTEEKDRVTNKLQSVQEDIKKLLRARGSVEQLQSLLKEKGVSLGTGSRLKPINPVSSSTRSSVKIVKGSINVDQSSSPSRHHCL